MKQEKFFVSTKGEAVSLYTLTNKNGVQVKITDMGGAVSAEHGVGKLKASFLETMYGAAAIEEMRELKRTIDPAFMLNPGNLFGAKD